MINTVLTIKVEDDLSNSIAKAFLCRGYQVEVSISKVFIIIKSGNFVTFYWLTNLINTDLINTDEFLLNLNQLEIFDLSC